MPNTHQFLPPFGHLRASFAVCVLPASFIVQSTRNLEENPWMIYCKLFNLCFLYLLTSSQPEPFIFPFISPLKTLTVSECVLMNRLDPALTLAACSLAKCSQEHRTWSQARMTWGHSELSLHSLIYKISIKNVLAACISRLLREADGTMYVRSVKWKVISH